MEYNFLNRVRQATATTGTGSSIVLATTAYSNAFFTMAEAGAVDQKKYTYIIEEGNNFEIQDQQTWTAGTRTFARGTPTISKVAGAAGTTKIDLQGGAQVRLISSAADLERFFRLRGLRTVTGATDTVENNDAGGMLIYNRASAVAVTLPQAGASSQFLESWRVTATNINTGVVTITPTTSTINGAATLVLNQGESATIFSDGTNYRAIKTYTQATATTLGVVELATEAEAQTGTDTTRVLTPAVHVGSHRPAFHATHTSYAVSTGVTQQIGSFVTTGGNNFLSGGTFSGSTWTPGIAGWYQCFATDTWPTSGGESGLFIYKNGGAEVMGNKLAGGGTRTAIGNASGMFYLDADDHIRVYGITDFASSPAFNGGAFGAFRVFP